MVPWLRVFDAEENEVKWDYSKFDKSLTINHDFGNNAPKGIYQVRTSGINYEVLPKAIPVKTFGLLAASLLMIKL
jgi:hypothetical protein